MIIYVVEWREASRSLPSAKLVVDGGLHASLHAKKIVESLLVGTY